MLNSCPTDDELRRKGLGDLCVLHDHLISYITFLLDLEAIVRLSCCSRILRVFSCEEPLWLGLSLKHQHGLVEFKANWRQTALLSYAAKPVPPEAIEAAARSLPPLPGLSSLFLCKRWYRCHADLRGFVPPADAATVERVGAAAITSAEFVERYDRPCLPVLLGGLQDAWPAASWSLASLCATFPTARFKVSKPHGGRAIMTLPAYVDYMARQADEEPLYVFDPTFVEAAPGMRKLYDIPHVFADDYFSHLLGLRPPYRWLVLGPARAGANWHVDPTLTSAWNALLSGRKRWALYPPHVRPPGVQMEDDGEDTGPSEDSLTSLQWFLEVYPSLPVERRPIEFMQEPGDVVFVPGGWWHCVLNLETSVAVTQNYVGEANLARVVRYMARGSSDYHAAPLDYYDRRTAVAAWAARYPYLLTEELAPEDGESLREQRQRRGEGDGVEGTAGAVEGRARAGHRVRGLLAERLTATMEQGAMPYERRTRVGDAEPRCGGGNMDADIDVDLEVNGGGGGGGGGGGSPGVPPLAWRGELAYDEVAVWRRHRPLGRWLRRLWELESRSRTTIQCCLAKYLHVDFWREALRTISAQHHSHHHHGSGGGGGGADAKDSARPLLPPEPTSLLEVMPLMGADALVFLYGGLAIKIFDHEVPALRGLMCALEAYVPRRLLPAAAAAAAADGCADHIPQLPQPLARGALAVRLTPSRLPGEEEEEERVAVGRAAGPDEGQEEQELLYLIQEQLQGTVELYDLLDRDPTLPPQQLEAVAHALGHLVGAMHAASANTPAADDVEDASVGKVAADGSAGAPATVGVDASIGAAATAAVDGDQKVGMMRVCAGDRAAAAVGGLAACSGACGGGVSGGVSAPLGAAQDWDRLVRALAVWHDRDGYIWASGLGCLNRPADAEAEEDSEVMAGGEERSAARLPQDASVLAVTREPSQAGGCSITSTRGGGSVISSGGDVVAPAAVAVRSGWICDVPQSSRWWPFVQHLRRRQRVVLRGLKTNTELPSWVRAQLPAYLPTDPAVLLGFGPPPCGAEAGASVLVQPGPLPPAARATVTATATPGAASGGRNGPGVMPLLLHADVTSHNVVLQDVPYDGSVGSLELGAGSRGVTGEVEKAAWRPRLCLVDFSDAGHGDPLYELLAVLTSCTAFDVGAMRRFWAAYRRHVDPDRVWPQRWRYSVRLSYSAMCYCLLHEEAELMLDRLWSGKGNATGADVGGSGGKRGEEAGGAAECSGGGGTGGASPAARACPSLEALATELWGFLDDAP